MHHNHHQGILKVKRQFLGGIIGGQQAQQDPAATTPTTTANRVATTPDPTPTTTTVRAVDPVTPAAAVPVTTASPAAVAETTRVVQDTATSAAPVVAATPIAAASPVTSLTATPVTVTPTDTIAANPIAVSSSATLSSNPVLVSTSTNFVTSVVPASTASSVVHSSGTASSSAAVILPTGTASTYGDTSSSSGLPTGAIVGSVAAALIGVILLGTFFGWWIRKWKRDKELSSLVGDNLFDKGDFRRESVLLDDRHFIWHEPAGGEQGEEYRSREFRPEMTESQSMPGLGLAATLSAANLSQSDGPRPPSALANVRRIQKQQQQQAQKRLAEPIPTSQSDPSFLPGQIFQHSPSMVLTSEEAEANANALSTAQNDYQFAPQSESIRTRKASDESIYSNESSVNGGANGRFMILAELYDERILSSLAEEEEKSGNVNRSGTPVQSNVQQYRRSVHKAGGLAGGHDISPSDSLGSLYYDDIDGDLSVAVDRNLSVRNTDDEEDPYAGLSH